MAKASETDASTWFIKDNTGDKVIVKVQNKESYGYARLDTIVKESPGEAKCPVARRWRMA